MLLAGCSAPTPASALAKAQKASQKGNHSQAIDILEKAHSKYSSDSDILEALAFAQLNSGDANKAGTLFQQLALDTTPDYHLYAATAFKKAQNIDSAIEAYSLYLLNEPQQSNPWIQLGELYEQNDNMAEALNAYQSSHKLEPTPQLALTIAQLAQITDNTTLAIQYYQSALKQAKAKRATDSEPTKIEETALVGLTQLAIKNKKISEAKRHLAQLNREFPDSEAIEDLTALVEPKAIEPINTVVAATTQPTQQDPTKESAEDFEKTYQAPVVATSQITEEKPEQPKVSPVTPITEVTISSEYTEDGVKTIVEPVKKPKPQPKDPFLIAVEKDSSNPRRWAELAQKKFLDGDYMWAETAYLEALRLKPQDPQYTLNYLEVVRKRRAPRDFINECEKLLERANGKIPELYLVTARAYRDLLKNNRNASILMQDFLKRYPNHLEINEVRAELNALPK